MITAQEATYTKLLKLAHPETNPDAVDSSTRIMLLKKFKDDPETLVELGRSWGLVEEADPSEMPLPDNAFDRITGEPINSLMVGSKVITPSGAYVVMEIMKTDAGYSIECINEEERGFKVFDRASRDQDAHFYSVGPHPKFAEFDYQYQLMKG